MPDILGSTLRIFHPAPGVVAFYDGRVEGVRAYSQAPNWLDDGAYSLGICSYAIVDGEEALVYDTHISPVHAKIIRRTLTDLGVRRFTVVLSHWHDDHVAGNEVFGDCEILAHVFTARALAEHRPEMESATPPIRPLLLPNRTYEGSTTLQIGRLAVEVRHVDIHSHDGSLLLLPDRELLFAGDALEDPITYVAEAGKLGRHLEELRRVAGWKFRRILPNHGSPEVIAAGGYEPSLLDATHRYVEKLLRCRTDKGLAQEDLQTFIAADLASGVLKDFPPYGEVHRLNVAAVLAAKD